MTKTVDEVITDIDAILDRAELACIAQLSAVMRADPKPGQIFACLELFHMQAYELNYNAFFVKDGKLSTEYACMPSFDGSHSFISELVGYLESIIIGLKWTEAQEHDFNARHEQQFLAWFKRVWASAGGARAKVPVYFCFEKEYRVQDVVSGRVMEELEAAQVLGHAVTRAN